MKLRKSELHNLYPRVGDVTQCKYNLVGRCQGPGVALLVGRSRGSIPGGVTVDFFRGSPRRNHVPWGRLMP